MRAVRKAASRYLTRTGNTDLLAVLGLSAGPKPLVEGRRPCGHCGRGVSLDGRCRRSSCYPGVLAAKAAAAGAR